MSDSDDSSLDQNEYSITDYFKLVRPLWEFQADTNYLDHHKQLRTLLDFSLTHSLYLKNLQKRELEFGDLEFSESFPDALVIRTKNNSSLSNVDHPYIYHGAFRNKYVEFCPQFALAAYLFSRFHVPDIYGSIELQLNENTRINLEEIKLLKGSHKLSSISYSQQHKSSVCALQLSKLNYKDINLSKLLSTQDFDDSERMLVLEKSNLPSITMARLAGFESVEAYKLVRDIMEPPEQLVEQIFPFLSYKKPEFAISPAYEQFKNVLLRLRRSLCQDMVILKRLYPNNPLSKHPIFNSDLFNNFAKEMVLTGGLDNVPLFPIPHETYVDTKIKVESFTRDGPQADNAQLNHLQKLFDEQSNKIQNLESLVNEYSHQHKFIYAQLSDYISKQNEVFQSQSELLQKIQNTTSGLLVLLSSRQKNMIPLAQLSLQETSEHLSTVGTSNLRQGINNTMELLGKLNEFHLQNTHIQQAQGIGTPHQHPLPISVQQQQPPPQHQPHHFAYKAIYQPTDPRIHIQPIQTSQIIPAVTVPVHATAAQESIALVSPEDIKRQAVLNRRLSRQASTLFEMWDDFKSLEKELKDHEITMTEWLKVHGSSERQFRHTRLKIIKFIEDEAVRTNSSTEYIKQRLHDKMRNRLRPWTLDEVQRMLTSGKRINLDD